MEKLELKNDNILVIFENDITVYDLKDINDITAYTKTKRNLKKCWDDIEKLFNDNTKFNDIINNFGKYNIRYHRYCGLD